MKLQPDKMMIPLSVVAILFSTGIGISTTGAYWVAAYQAKVDERLSRIEDKLGIARPEEQANIPKGYYKVVKNDNKSSQN